MNKKSLYLYFLIIFIISLILRIYKLDLLPLYPDESGGHYYNLWWLKTNSFFSNPLSYITYKITSFTWFLGVSELAVRLPSAIYASILPIVIYWMTSTITYSKTSNNNLLSIPLISSLLVIFMPWSYMIGRIGHSNTNLMLIFFMISIGFIIRNQFIYSFVTLILSVYFYPSTILLSFSLSLYVLFVLKKNYVINITHIFLVLIFITTIIGIFLFKYRGLDINSRALDLAIWRDVNVTAETNYQRGLARDSQPSILSLYLNTETLVNKVFLNRYVAIINEFGQNYFSFWDPEWLFISGDPILRHSTGFNGQLYWWTAPFLAIGFYYFFRYANLRTIILFSIIIILSPVPASITNDGKGYLLRVITILPVVTYLISIGISMIGSMIKEKLSLLFIALIFFLTFVSSWNFLFKYFHAYPQIASHSFEDGWKELALWQNNNQDKPLIIIWQGYYPTDTIRFWQRKFDNYPDQIISHRIGNANLNQINSNLYFFWPSEPNELSNLNSKIDEFYVAFPNNYLDDYPSYQNLLGNYIVSLDGKYINTTWDIWTNKTSWISQSPQ